MFRPCAFGMGSEVLYLFISSSGATPYVSGPCGCAATPSRGNDVIDLSGFTIYETPRRPPGAACQAALRLFCCAPALRVTRRSQRLRGQPWPEAGFRPWQDRIPTDRMGRVSHVFEPGQAATARQPRIGTSFEGRPTARGPFMQRPSRDEHPRASAHRSDLRSVAQAPGAAQWSSRRHSLRSRRWAGRG